MADIHQRLGHLAVPERTRLLRLLEQQELAVGEISRVVQIPQPNISRHLKALEDDGWVISRREGTARMFAIGDALSEEQRRLWEVVGQAVATDHPEDARRLASVLSTRSGDTRRFFGEVAGRWPEVRRELYGQAFLLPTLMALLPESLRVADLGCGTGDILAVLAPHVAQAIGVDREPAMLEEARLRMQGMATVEVREGSLEELPLDDGCVDAALLMLVLHHVDSPTAVLTEAARVLAPGGRVIVLDMVAHDREAYRRQMGHVFFGFDRDDLAGHAASAGLMIQRYTVLPPDPEASGPALFVSVLSRFMEGAAES